MKLLNKLRGFPVAALIVLAAGSTATAQTFGIFEVTDTRTSVTGEVSVFNDCIFLPDSNAASRNCSFTDIPLGPAAFAGSPMAEISSYCFIRARVSQSFTTCNRTRAWTASGMEAWEDDPTGALVVQFQIHSMNLHESEMFCDFSAYADSETELYMDIEVPGPGPTQLIYYDFRGFIGAESESEGQGEDFAEIELEEFSVAGVDMMAAGSLPTFFSTDNSPGAQNLALSGYMYVPTNTEFSIVVRGRSEALINAPGEDKFTWGCGSQWVDDAYATFFGNLTLSTVALPVGISPDEEPGLSYFSIDIGSASELSDPDPTGAEYFDPGDAYRIGGPVLPSGGENGFFDDGVFMGFDFPPTPPDTSIPAMSAAPVASGLPPASVIPQYLNIDAIARTEFDIPAFDGTVGFIPLPLNSPCVFSPGYLYVSFDDDPPGHYTSTSPSVPATATPDFTGRVFGSGSGRDEITELFALSPYLGGGYAFTPLARESDVHPNLAPNPSLIGPDEENDDVNALSMAYSPDCNVWYFSVDHEATGVLPDGTAPDPGTIYRTPNIAGEDLVAVAGPSELGIPAGTDIDAFEFVRLSPPPDLYPDESSTPFLAVLFSVDWDDPLTPNVDESGGMMPNTLYASFMDGSYFVYDSIYLSGNIDAISNLLYSISNPPQVNTCNPYNFTDPPQNFQVEITGNTLTAEWDPYPFAVKCQLAGNRTDQPGDRTFIVDNVLPPDQNSFNFASSQIQPGATYRLRVRCGCSTANVSPFTAYEIVTASGPLPPPTGEPYLFADQDEPVMELFPNPADAFVTLQSNEATDGRVTVRVFNALGQAVLAETFDASELTAGRRIETSGLTRGMYSVQAEMPGRIETLQLMITR